MKRSVVIKRLGYEAPAGWTTYGTSLAAFSLFQGITTQYEASLERGGQTGQFALPSRREFHSFRTPQRDVMVCYFALLAVNSAGGRLPCPPSTLRVNLISSPATLPL